MSNLGTELREAAVSAAAGWSAYTYPASYEIALLSGGSEISGNGYERTNRCTGVLNAATWTRSVALISVTVTGAHGLRTGDQIIVSVSSSTGAVALSTYSVTVTGDSTFEITGTAGGAASGTLSYTSPAFWGPDADGNPVQDIAVLWGAAASGGDWTFDEVRFIKPGTSGSYMIRFTSTGPVTVKDGDTLNLPAGTFTITDLSEAA